MDFYTTVGLASSAVTLADKSRDIKDSLDKIYRLLTQGKRRIAVFGAGGTGKTTLAYKLTGKAINSFTYHESPNIEKVSMKGKIIGEYSVAPGQEKRADRYWPELYQEITKGKVNGIINVVAGGFHSVGIDNMSYTQTDYYKEGSEGEFLNNFLTSQKDVEIDILRKLADEVAKAPNKIWMVTLVNKQDLWWHDRASVKKHYMSEAYNTIIEDIHKSKGIHNFNHEYISAALFNLNFRIGNDFVRETASGYDEPLRTSNYSNFVKLLNSLIDAG